MPPRAWADTSPRDAIRKRYFPDMLLRSHEGKRLRLYEDLIRDKIVAINFMYLGCDDSCPISTANLVQAQKLLGRRVGRDIFMYSITLDPEFDRPEALRQYARQHGVGPGWLFLSAEPRQTELLRRKLGFYDRNPKVDARRSAHAGMVRIGNEPRQLWSMASTLVDPAIIARNILWVDNPTS